MSEEEDSRPRHRRRTISAIVASTAIVAVGIAILERRSIATDVIDAKLAEARVPHAYRVTAFSAFATTLEDVRLGDPAHPDLVAKRLTVGWRYRAGWPEIARVRIEGGRVAARWQDGRLSLGTLDRLLPTTRTNGPVLPDIDATIVDGRLALLTAAGPVTARIGGEGNLAYGFKGRIGLAAPALAIGGCAIEGLRAEPAIGSEAQSPLIDGPVAIDHAICPTRHLMLGAGRLAVNVRLAPDLSGARGRLAPNGFAGRSGGIAFGTLGGSIDGTVGAEGGRGGANLFLASIAAAGARAAQSHVNGRWRFDTKGPGFEGALYLAGLVLPDGIADRLATIGPAAEGTPIAPIAMRAGGVLADVAARSDVEADIAFGPGGLHIDGATFRGSHAALTIAGSYTPAANGGWEAEGEFAESSGTIPPLSITASRAGPAAPIRARIAAATLTAPDARLALAPVEIVSTGATTRFATVAVIDGPLGSGRIEGLHLPVAGRSGPGGLALGEGCATVSFRRLTQGSLALDPAAIRLCGAPAVVSAAGIAAEVRDLHLTGHSGAAPLSLAVARIGWKAGAISAEGVAARLGEGDDPTRLDLASIEGAPGEGGFAGHFTDAAGSIGHVPLALSGGMGQWRFAGGALHLSGGLAVADRDASPRFLPMASSDVALALVNGRITGTASLQPQGRKELVANVTLRHDLTTGAGEADLAVPGVTFRKAGLQPEMLTPLTLGVVANVIGTVRGAGHIAWDAKGTTSSGDFRTDALDFAAAFGPVSGVTTQIHFTDLLGFVSAPHQEARIAGVNPGVIVSDGVAHYQLLPGNRVAVEEAHWPFAGGTLVLEPSELDFSHPTDRRLTFTITKLDAAAFVQQLDFPNIAATGTFDGRLPMLFDAEGGRIVGGTLVARGPGTLAYVGALSSAELGTMGKLAFDALKAVRYSGLAIDLDGKLDGEVVTQVRFDGVRQDTGTKGIVARALRKVPFRFNIRITAPFRGLIGSARAYANPELLLQGVHGLAVTPAPVQPPASAHKR